MRYYRSNLEWSQHCTYDGLYANDSNAANNGNDNNLDDRNVNDTEQIQMEQVLNEMDFKLILMHLPLYKHNQYHPP